MEARGNCNKWRIGLGLFLALRVGIEAGSLLTANMGQILMQGDVLKEVNRILVRGVSDFSRVIGRLGMQSELLLINRGGIPFM